MIKARAQQWVLAARSAAVTAKVALIDREGTTVWEGDVVFPFTTANDAGYLANAVSIQSVIDDNISEMEDRHRVMAFTVDHSVAHLLLANTGAYGGSPITTKSKTLSRILGVNIINSGVNLTNPASDVVAASPSDSAVLAPFRGFACAGAGLITYRTLAGNVVAVPVAAGVQHGYEGDMIHLTGTTATGIVILY